MERRKNSPESDTTNSSLSPSESTRTTELGFVESTVNEDATPNSPRTESQNSDNYHPSKSLSPISQSLADRLRRLAAVAWTLEQDDDLSDTKRNKIESTIGDLEVIIEEERWSQGDSMQQQSVPRDISSQQAPEPSENTTADQFGAEGQVNGLELFRIHENLIDVLAGMRLRQQEQRHLHQLTATKLEAVAQRCLFQEQQMQDLVREAKSLRIENKTLGQENDKLKDSIAELESEASKKEVAVTAMTTAVAGLEGWIDDSQNGRYNLEPEIVPVRTSHQRRTVIRGKGRFRGRYYVDEDQERYRFDSPDARELQDGVKAWIRGFRDVEDACGSVTSRRVKESYGGSLISDDDEWGDFESPGSNHL